MSQQAASIIIPVYNCVNYTRQCLGSLADHTGPSVEIIVVDNGSTDGTGGFLRAAAGRVRTVTNRSNLGYAKACNQGYRHANGRFLVFLNNDTIVTPHWLTYLLNCFAADERAGLVTPKLLYPQSRRIQYAGVAFRPNGLPYILRYRESDAGRILSKPQEVPAAGGACMAVKREVFEGVGLFDEGYLNGLEDIDLSLKIKQAGYKTLCCPQSVVYHYESRTVGRSSHNAENARYYLNKWKDHLKISATGDVAF